MEKRGQWSSNIGFILAAAGSAVGLGNIWKFPGKVADNGGGAFMLIYLAIIVLVGFSVMLAELALGRRSQSNAVASFRKINKKFSFIGALGVFTAFVIASYYCVVGGWVVRYVIEYISGGGFAVAGDTAQYEGYFVNLISNPAESITLQAIFLILCILVIIRGVSGGIEKVSKLLMPLLLVILVAIVIRSLTLEGASEGLSFMLTFDFSTITMESVAVAMGQAFFSLSLGMSIMITYGSYVPKKENLAKSTLSICTIDTMVALLAAFAIIPAVFASGTDMGMGAGFAFISLPNVFAQMPFGNIFGLLFFALLLFAAFTSAISIVEGTVAYACEEFKLTRVKATIIIGILAFILGVGYSLSQGAVALNIPWFNEAGSISLGNFMEFFTDNFSLPLGALLTCVFVGFVWKPKNAIAEIEQNGLFKFSYAKIWTISIKFICPLVLAVILFYTLVLGVGLS